MEMAKKFFSQAFKATELKDLIIAIIIYIVIGAVGGAVIGLLAQIPILGIIFTIVGSLVDLYALIGIILSILVFLKVVK